MLTWTVSSYSDEDLDSEVAEAIKDIQEKQKGTIIDIKFSTSYYEWTAKDGSDEEKGHLFAALILYKV